MTSDLTIPGVPNRERTMKHTGWLMLGLVLAAGFAQSATAAEKVPTFGVGPAYEAIAKVPVLHAGRRKPFDTLAREVVKQIYSREMIALWGPDEEHEGQKKVVAKWGPVGALLDWSIRPDFWDDQPIILCEYIPLKRLILADASKAQLLALAAKEKTTEADRKALTALASAPDLNAPALHRFIDGSGLSKEDNQALNNLAGELGEEQKWLSPRTLETAQVQVGDQKLSFRSVVGRVRPQAPAGPGRRDRQDQADHRREAGV